MDMSNNTPNSFPFTSPTVRNQNKDMQPPETIRLLKDSPQLETITSNNSGDMSARLENMNHKVENFIQNTNDRLEEIRHKIAAFLETRKPAARPINTNTSTSTEAKPKSPTKISNKPNKFRDAAEALADVYEYKMRIKAAETKTQTTTPHVWTALGLRNNVSAYYRGINKTLPACFKSVNDIEMLSRVINSPETAEYLMELGYSILETKVDCKDCKSWIVDKLPTNAS